MGKKKGGNKNKNQQPPSGGVVSNTSITSNDNDHEVADHHHQEEEMPPTTTATTTTTTIENDDNNNDMQQQQHHEDPASNDNHNDDAHDDVPPPTEQHHQEEEEAEHQEQEIQQEQQSAVPAVIDVPSPAVAENSNSFSNEPVDAVSTTAKLEGEAAQQQQDGNDDDNTAEEVAVDDPPTDASATATSITNQQQQQDHEENNNNNNNSPLAANVVMEQSNDENNAESLSLSTAASNQQQQQQQPRMASTSDFNEALPQVAEPRPFGKVIGFGKNGTPAFSCGSSSDNEDRTDSTGSIIQPEALTPYGVVTGRQWSDVEYVRRWLLMAKDTMMPQVAKSSDVWFDSSANVQFKHLSNPSSSSGVTKFQNHVAVEAPLTGDILVWDNNSNSNSDDHGYPLGHVAIVFDVTATTITIGEQGVNKWETETYSRKLKMTKDEVTKSVSVFEDNNDDSSSRIIGWVRVLAPPLGGQNITEISDRYRHIVSKGTLTRTPFEPDVTLPWLDKSVPWDNFQIQSFSDGCPGATPSVDIVPSGYYTVDYDLWLRARHLAENLHRLMYSTTHRLIMESENSEKGTQTLEKVFGIPRALHPLLRQSLHTPSVTGRFDIGFDAHGNKDNGTEPGALKVFEYNCDSSACLLETMESQEKVAKHYKFDHIGQSGGLPLKNRLEWWWREFARTQYPKLIPAGQTPTRVIHFMVDDDHEERYTALCMMEAARAAKFETKMCVKLIDFRKMENGDIVDLGGNVVQCVWKTWSWDTALTLYQKQQNNNQNQNQNHKNLETSSTTSSSSQQVAVPPPTSPGNTNTNTSTNTTTSSTKVQLTDILFHPRIIVFEPFWKSVCGNKGLLPYLSEADPNNEFLLKAFFDKNEAISKSYVRKPVSGRTGANITVHDETDGNKSANKEDVSTGGKWGEGQFIYQEKLSVTVLDGNYPTLCSWVVGSGFGGMVVREAKHMVTQLESPVAPLRVKREV